MSTKTKSTLSDTPKSKASPATPRVSKPSRGLTKSNADSPSPLQNSRPPVEKSPRSVTSKPTAERRSPRLSTPPNKKPTRILKPSELQADLNVVQEDLNKAKEKLIVCEKEKVKALDELKEAQRLADEANEKLREALVAQKRAEESSEIEKFRAVEMEQAGIEAAQKKEEEWQKELEDVHSQHAQDAAALLAATQELDKVKQELVVTCDAKKQALAHADDATKISEIQAAKVEKLSAEVVRLKSLLDSRTEEEANENAKLVSELKQEIDVLRQELVATCDAKILAISHADDATKIAEENAEKIEKLSAEVVHLKSLLDSRNEEAANENAKLVSKLKVEIESLSRELEIYKAYEKKMVEQEAIIEQLNVDLEAAKVAESYASNLAEEWRKRVEELEIETNEAKRLEKSASESLESIMKQLEGSNDQLHDAETEIASLKETVALLEISIRTQKRNLEESEQRAEVSREEASKFENQIGSLRSELEITKEEKNQSLNNEKLAATSVQTLLEEKNKLITELENSKDEEEKSKKAMESLASALHEVSAEAREVKEQLLSFQADRQNFESELEDLKLVLKATNEKYEHMLDDAKKDVDILTNSLEQSKQENKKLKDEWEQKELRLMQCAKESEEKIFSMEKEISKLLNLLNESEEKACSAKEEETKLKNSLKEAESEKEVLGQAKAESMQLKEKLMDKEKELQNILQENEEVRTREAASLKKVEELSKLLDEALSKTQAEENGELSDSEKDYDMLPKVVEFSEQNGGGREEKKSKLEVLPQLYEQSVMHEPHELDRTMQDKGVHTGTEGENKNSKEEGNEIKEKGANETEEVVFKMWESCKIEEKDFSPEKELEQESFDEDMDSKAEGSENLDQINGLSSTESVKNGGTSPLKEQSQKKKKPLLSKFGSLLKKKGTTTQK